MKGIAVYLLITKHFYNNFKEKESDLRMATNRKLRILLKKIYPNGNIDTIFFKSRAKDVLVDESGTETLADIVEKVNDMNEGATKVEDSSTNGNIKINGTETNVYTHPNSGATAGTYNSVTVNSQGHVTAGTKVTNWTGTVSGNASNATTTFSQASTRTNISSGSTLSTTFGRIMKWFADLKSLAFVDKVGTANLDSTLTTAYNKRVTTDKVTTSTSITASGWVADARAVATLQNQINTINSNYDKLHELYANIYHFKTDDIGDHKAIHLHINTTVGAIWFLIMAFNEATIIKVATETTIGELTRDGIYTNIICDDGSPRFRYAEVDRQDAQNFRIKISYTESIYIADVLFISSPINTVTATIAN